MSLSAVQCCSVEKILFSVKSHCREFCQWDGQQETVYWTPILKVMSLLFYWVGLFSCIRYTNVLFNHIALLRQSQPFKILLTGCSLFYIYIPWPFPPVWGVADNTKEQQKQWGFYSVLLAMTRDPAEFVWHCWSNTAHPTPSSTTYVAS